MSLAESSKTKVENAPLGLAPEVGSLAVGETMADPFEGLFEETELKILASIVAGDTVMSMSKRLRIPMDDVSSYRRILLRKFGIPTNVQDNNLLTYKALAYGIVPFELNPNLDAVSNLLPEQKETLQLAGQGHTVYQIATMTKTPVPTAKDRRYTAASVLTGENGKRAYNYPVIAFQFGVLEPKSLEEKLAFAETVRQAIDQYRSIIINTRPPTLEELTIINEDGSIFTKDVRPDGTYHKRRLRSNLDVIKARQAAHQQQVGRLSTQLPEFDFGESAAVPPGEELGDF